jgi:hypothetical protein
MGLFWNSSRLGWVTVRRRSTGEMPASLWTVRRGRRTTPSDGGLRWRGARCAEPVVDSRASAACRRLAGAERLSCGCCQTSVPIRGQIQPSAMERGARLRSDPIKTGSPFLLSISAMHLTPLEGTTTAGGFIFYVRVVLSRTNPSPPSGASSAFETSSAFATNTSSASVKSSAAVYCPTDSIEKMK